MPQRDKEYVVRADIPGCRKSEIHVEVHDGNVLRFGHNPLAGGWRPRRLGGLEGSARGRCHGSRVCAGRVCEQQGAGDLWQLLGSLGQSAGPARTPGWPQLVQAGRQVAATNPACLPRLPAEREKEDVEEAGIFHRAERVSAATWRRALTLVSCWARATAPARPQHGRPQHSRPRPQCVLACPAPLGHHLPQPQPAHARRCRPERGAEGVV